MSFSRLLLVAASSKKSIAGEGNDKVLVSPKISLPGRDAYEGEVILCFQLDERTDRGKQIRRSLGITEENQKCDGLIFYAQDEKTERVICLVEMKGTNISEAPGQLIATKDHLEKLLHDECNSLPEECRSDCRKQIARIIWKACLYHHGSSDKDLVDAQRKLKDQGFSDVATPTAASNDLRSLLSGKGRDPRDMARKYKGGKRR